MIIITNGVVPPYFKTDIEDPNPKGVGGIVPPWLERIGDVYWPQPIISPERKLKRSTDTSFVKGEKIR